MSFWTHFAKASLMVTYRMVWRSGAGADFFLTHTVDFCSLLSVRWLHGLKHPLDLVPFLITFHWYNCTSLVIKRMHVNYICVCNACEQGVIYSIIIFLQHAWFGCETKSKHALSNDSTTYSKRQQNQFHVTMGCSFSVYHFLVFGGNMVWTQ